MSDDAEVFNAVLDALDDAKVLGDVILIGGWAQHLYRKYFNDPPELSALRTVDIDILFTRPPQITAPVPLEPVFESLGFHRSFNPDGSTRFVSRAAEVEFLIPDRGKGDAKAYQIQGLAIAAQSLRLLDMLTIDTIHVRSGSHTVRLPDPVRFCFHKLLVSERRLLLAKREKDLQTAIELASLLYRLPEWRRVLPLRYRELPPRQRACVIRLLREAKSPIIEELGRGNYDIA